MTSEVITLREYLEQKLVCERELREMESHVTQRALEINSTEMKRRLEDLNHAHTQHMDMLAKTVPRENWEQRNKEIDGKFEQNERRAEAMAAALADRVAAASRALEERVAATADVLNKQMGTMASSMTLAQGKSLGMTKAMGGLVIILNIILAVAMYFKK